MISDPCRECFMGFTQFIFFLFSFFFFFFPPRSCPGHISATVTRRDSRFSVHAWSCSLILHYCLPTNSLRYFFFYFFFIFSCQDFVRAISLNRYSQILQIECAAWSCDLILHCCLPSNSLCYYFFFSPRFGTILSGPYLWNRYSQRLQIECAAWSCGLIFHYCLPSNSLFFFLFCHNFVRAIFLEPLLAETPN